MFIYQSLEFEKSRIFTLFFLRIEINIILQL